MASVNAWAAPACDNESASISVNVDVLDFGEVEVGYPVVKSLMVTGNDLQGNINLKIESSNTAFYEVTPSTISPEAALSGVLVSVKFKPFSAYVKAANLRLSSEGVEDVVIPITAAPFFPETMFVKNMTEQFTAPAGGFASRTGAVRFADAEVPTDPNTPVVMAPKPGDDVELTLDVSIVPPQYSLLIEGDDSQSFMAQIVKGSTIANICTVKITYLPKACGTHEAVLKLRCSTAGVPLVTIPLRGESTEVLGDIDNNGVLNIGDVTGLIGLLLNGTRSTACADFNCDGKLSIADVTALINCLLNQ